MPLMLDPKYFKIPGNIINQIRGVSARDYLL